MNNLSALKPIRLKTTSWQTELANAITDPQELLNLLKLDQNLLPAAKSANQLFKLLVPRCYLSKIEPGNPDDPLLKQVLPLAAEHELNPLYELDPLKEKQANKIPGLLHKYPSRVLLTVTGACGIHCRYCFRRHFPYQQNRLSTKNIEAILAYLYSQPAINEVIYSGGDPLIAPDDYLAKLTAQLANIPHLNKLRIHSRLPITIPSRITEDLINWIKQSRLQIILVVHCNHPNEIDQTTKEALQKLKQANVTLLNQSVLLKGVNDSADVLATLSEKLFEIGVLPYYLHLLDKVQGATHFDMPVNEAKSIYQELQKKLPGYLLPKLVREDAKQLHKILVT